MSVDRRPVTRRAYLNDLAAGGVVLIGSIVWGYAARTVVPPAEDDHHRKVGDMVAPRVTPTPRSSPPPEQDYLRTGGAVAPPPPKESDYTRKEGKLQVPPRKR